MAKLHELLAVEKDLIGKANKLLTEGKDTFSKRTDLFSGFTKTLTMFSDDDKHLEEAAAERKEMVTTVREKLAYVVKALSNVSTVRLRKDRANATACADIEVDGEVLAFDVPATTLLSLEDTLRELRILFDTIPTLEPGVKWELAPDMGEGVYRRVFPDRSIRTKKKTIYVSAAKATDKHPEQIREETQDVNIGEYVTHTFSGRISPREKMILLDKIEKLSAAVKTARARANEESVPNVNLDPVFDFIFK